AETGRGCHRSRAYRACGQRSRCGRRRMARRFVHELSEDRAMRIRTDDDVYRVDAVWLGPPKATFPWRARYVAWGVGIPMFLVVLAVERQLGIGFGFFSTAWAF